jgi:hypothetical protein
MWFADAMPAAHLDRRRPRGRFVQDPDDLLFAEALPLRGESSCPHGYQENSPPAWTDSRGEAQKRWVDGVLARKKGLGL